MAALTFGSFGDIVALTQIAIQVYGAIDGSGSAAQELKASRTELDSFLTICNVIERTITSDAAIHQEDLASLKAAHTVFHIQQGSHQAVRESDAQLHGYSGPYPRQVLLRRHQGAYQSLLR
jgi:hypothetical protein